MRSRTLLVLGVFVAVLAVGWLASRNSSSPPQPGKALVPAINKQPAAFANHTFDPAAPPPDMPPLSPGEIAVCDSNFISYASIGGQPRRTDAMHATLTIAKVNVTLQLNINIWVPIGVTEHVIEHEIGRAHV